jgi:uncharacterized protein (DUF1800 family)
MPAANAITVKHLLARTLFGFSRTDFEKAMGYGSLQMLVDNAILAPLSLPAAPNSWTSLVPAQAQQNSGDANRWYNELTQWWNKRMFTQGLNMQEKMVLFLHNHFSCERDKVNYPQYMYQQNQLFRKYAFGNFKQLVKDISVDPTMLIYLDGNNSRGTAPNENYGRELLELFTLGIGNYSENDVKQAAKVLSGYQVKGLDVAYDATRSYKETSVTILGKTAKFNVNSLVDLIFEQKACAEFICRKIYQQFVYYKADEVFVKKMADVFRTNNFELKPLLRFLLLSDEFYKPSILASRIKDPQELMIGSLKALQVPAPDWANVFELAKTLQMQLFQPPDVAGWPGQRDWISSNTYPYRGGYTDSLLSGKRYNGANVTGKVDTLVYARSFSTSENAAAFVNQLIDLFILFPISDTKRTFLLETMLDGTIAANWSTSTLQANVRVARVLKAIMRMPEFQLN